VEPGVGQRGYTIPLVDLSEQIQRQVVVDREPGQYLGHPTTVLLEDGRTMIAVYPKGHGRGAIVMKRSTDGGRTWSQRLPAYVSSYTKAAIWCRRDPQGRLAILLLNASANPLASVFLHLHNAERLEVTPVAGQTKVLEKTGLDGPYSIFNIPGPGPWEPVLLTIH
jgi:hypothetical protein